MIKIMDYEKLYKEALERCKKEFNFSNLAYSHEEIKQKLERVFPELHESEDERIRKELIRDIDIAMPIETAQRYIAWLKKQGEQKSWSEEDEQHCKWILEYLYDGLRKSDKQFKDQFKSAISWLEKQGKQKPIIIIPQFKVGDIIKPKPYNEEHLIKDINENGYVLDVDVTIPFKDEDVWEIVEQKSAWSKEDEEMYQSILDDTVQKYLLDGNQFAWFKSLKDRVQSQPKQEWSEEDEKLLNSAISLVYEVGDISLHSWLKSIKDRVQPQPKQEWRKEDSERLNRIYKFIWANRKGDTDEIYQQEQDADWLMTLNLHPKQEWSEEDKNMLLSIINDAKQGAELDKEQINWLNSIKS